MFFLILSASVGLFSTIALMCGLAVLFVASWHTVEWARGGW